MKRAKLLLSVVTHSTRKAKLGTSGIQGQSVSKNPNKFQGKSRNCQRKPLVPALERRIFEFEASLGYTETPVSKTNPKLQTKVCRVQRRVPKARGRPEARPARALAHRASAGSCGPGPVLPTPSHEAGRARALRPAHAAPDGEREGTSVGHAVSRHPLEDGKREGPACRPASCERGSPGKRVHAGRGRRVAPEEARGRRKCAGRVG